LDSEICAYCGEDAECLDHVIPYSYTSAVSSKKRKGGSDVGFKIPACSQCNSILSDKIFRNIVERKEYVHKRLRKILHRYNAVVQWDESEMAEMGWALRQAVEAQQARCVIARDRLRYASAPPDAKWIRMEIKWRESMNEEPSRCRDYLKVVA